MGSNGLYAQKFLDGAGPAAEGAYVVSPSVPYGRLAGASAQWYANYKARYNAEPNGYAIYTYDAARVALDGIRRAGKVDRVAIREAIFATRDFDGALGRWSFTDTGDITPSTVYGRQVKNGRFDEAGVVPLTQP